MARHNNLGKWGEQMAVDTLSELGYSIVDTNWRMGRIEIDIIAKKDKTLVFAEVKTRTDMDEDPLEAVDNKKIARMVAAAESFLETHPWPYQVQFDLFAINGTPDEYKIEHIPDAFYPPLKKYR